MLFALDHLESIQIKPDLNFNQIYLNDSVLRISFELNSNEWKNEVIKVAELFKYQKMQSHELEEI